MSVVIDCPSGMQLRIRGLKGKEGKLLADKVAIRQGTLLDHMLIACTEEVVSSGPYTLRPDGKVDWSEVLLGDRLYVLLQIRLASFGPEYQFKVQCREQTCRERFDYEVNLTTDLVVARMSPEDRDTFVEKGGIFTTNLTDGTEVKYRLATGADEKAIARNRGASQALVDMLALRIVSIDGVGEAAPGKAQKSIRTYLEDLEWSELIHLLNSLDAHDCGVRTEIEIECPYCSGVQEVQLPFERRFFMPSEVTTKTMQR